MRPEFLGLFSLVAMASLGVGYWAASQPDPVGGGAGPQQQHREYVGIQPSELGLELPCEPECYVEWLWDAWLRDHPGVEVLSKTPRHDQGVLIGYDVVYRAT